MNENNEAKPPDLPDSIVTTHRKTETVTTAATGAAPPKLWIDTEAKQQFVEKILLMFLSATVSFLVATWYAGRTLGILEAHDAAMAAEIAGLKSQDITPGARAAAAALLAQVNSLSASNGELQARLARVEVREASDSLKLDEILTEHRVFQQKR